MASEHPHIFLFTNSGTLRPTSAEEARITHNATAGNPQGVAAAQALGDLSHLVYVPMGEWSGEIIFMDQWTSAEGIQRFFADPQVQAGGAQMFTAYDPVIWRQAEGFLNYTIKTPQGQQEHLVGMIRGKVTSLETAQQAMNQVWSTRINEARKLGLSGHEVFIRLAQPGAPEALEVLGVDTWFKHDGIHQLYDDPSFLEAFDGVFSAEPKTWVLHRPAGAWIEW
jgi:hypothetical protein